MKTKFKLELECMEFEDAKVLQQCVNEAADSQILQETMRKVDELMADKCTNLEAVLIGLEILKKAYFEDKIGRDVVVMCLIGTLFKEEMMKLGAVPVNQMDERGKEKDEGEVWKGLDIGGLKH